MSRNPPHKWLLNIQPDAKQTFDMLPGATKQGVFRRLKELLNADDPYSLRFVEMLKAKKFERVRNFALVTIGFSSPSSPSKSPISSTLTRARCF